MKKVIIYATVFLCGAVVMALELVAARVLAPYVGSSNLIWTSIIGIILISMSLGYWLGGKMADSQNSFNVLASLIVAAAVMISIIPILETYLIKGMALTPLPLTVVAIISAITTFSIPSALLAMVSPYSIKLMEANGDNVGSISGRLSAISTMGSIFGTFFTGFCLIPIMGNRMIILLSAIVLIALTIFLFENKNKKHILGIVLVMIFSICNVALGKVIFDYDNPNVLADIDSEYSRILVKKQGEYKTLQVDTAIESYIKNDGSMTEYLNYYDLADCYMPESNEVLIIGGAAYTYPMHFLSSFANKNIDVVEIDPMMTKVAKKFFGLKEDERLSVYHQDGRSFVNKNTKKYDAILVDAFKGFNVPQELTTVEAYTAMKNSLKSNGMVIVNVISALEGDKAGFIEHEFSTFKEVFEDVKVFDVGYGDKTKARNIILIGFNYTASEMESEKYGEMLKKEVKGFKSDKDAFTDDYAPVEKYCM